jgi:hypothetical protein
MSKEGKTKLRRRGVFDMPFVIAKPLEAWARQATDAMAALERKAGRPLSLRESAEVDHRLFATLIEALVALAPHTGQRVADDLVALARLRPVEEVIEG